ncbi:23S rRNA (uracil(1939)-C(5))-methyltransferase RlmD [uncultured Anaerococcus sp.]|uniref:23S rRNA (uracil(1939)-C(5))-methyltransferase RlmD n=1 Tax=uncultured Anaerococcus sp. TaxID=293428 RepID=UPI0025EA33E4|nr:23S rRNA (uracil(1939)-C(5))-methyltransferase RlmD [uncultured Anaerococcus sp.]
MRKNKNTNVKINEVKYPNISIGTDENENIIEFKGGVLGQTCNVKITRNRKDYKKGKYIELVEHSSLENSRDFCPQADICGGCAYQRMPYETELMLKQDMIKKLLAENNITYEGDIPINRSPITEGFRNKMEYTFGDAYKGGELILGLHRQNRFYEIVDTIDCNVIDSDFNKIRSAVQKYFREKNTSFYHKSRREGLLRHFIIRKAHRTGEIMCILVTTSDESFDEMRKTLFVNFLKNLNLDGQIVSIFHVTNDSVADAVIPEKIDIIFGKDHITEEMLGLKFNISPFSFFQPNVYTAEKLYQKAFEFAKIDDSMNVLDLYSGTGTITQVMASVAKQATGIEIVDEAVEKAYENAKLNEIKNINFLCGDVLEQIENVKGDYDVVILDPPRAGISPEPLEKILKLNPKKYVYISCNPKTQVENLKTFLDNGYNIKNYEIFDQFPNSRHLETICLLTNE